MPARQSRIGDLASEISALGAKESLDPKAEQWGRMMALFGADPQKVETAIELWEMPLWALVFELVSVSAFFFAFGTVSSRDVQMPAQPARRQSVPLKVIPARPYRKAEAEADLRDMLRAGESPKQTDLAERWRRSQTWVSRLVKDLEKAGRIAKRIEGGKLAMLML